MALAVVQLRRGKRLAPYLLPVLLFAALILLMLFSLTLGRYPVPFAEVVRIVFTTFPVNAKGDYTNARRDTLTRFYAGHMRRRSFDVGRLL